MRSASSASAVTVSPPADLQPGTRRIAHDIRHGLHGKHVLPARLVGNDPRADPLRTRDQAEFPESAERLPHGRPADAEALAQLLFRRQQRAHGAPAVEDLRRECRRH
jgi:hypothetical protein